MRPGPSRRLCVAPMMECTDRHDRYFLRLITRRALLYTEMIAATALLRGDAAQLLAHDPFEHPVAVQLGGSDPAELAACARLAEDAGYAEVNLNVGCPSDRVRSGRFGACLMAEPGLVAECVAAMAGATALPVTVKTRIGIDHRDSYAELLAFVDTVAAAGCGTFVVHARKAWLTGLSPRENREVPPLRYDVVRRLKADRPALEIVLNGGITSLDEAESQLEWADGVMLGRAAYHDPCVLAGADRRLFGDTRPVPTREEVVAALLPYVERELARGTRLSHITRHLLGLYNGVRGARAWRRHLSEHAIRPGAGAEVLRAALARVETALPSPCA